MVHTDILDLGGVIWIVLSNENGSTRVTPVVLHMATLRVEVFFFRSLNRASGLRILTADEGFTSLITVAGLTLRRRCKPHKSLSLKALNT